MWPQLASSSCSQSDGGSIQSDGVQNVIECHTVKFLLRCLEKDIIQPFKPSQSEKESSESPKSQVGSTFGRCLLVPHQCW